jgi:hypothetical protein
MICFVVFLVRSDKTAAIVHFEAFKAADLNPQSLATRIIARTGELTATYPLETHDVSSISYDTFAALSRAHPELDGEEADLTLWS